MAPFREFNLRFPLPLRKILVIQSTGVEEETWLLLSLKAQCQSWHAEITGSWNGLAWRGPQKSSWQGGLHRAMAGQVLSHSGSSWSVPKFPLRAQSLPRGRAEPQPKLSPALCCDHSPVSTATLSEAWQGTGHKYVYRRVFF